MISSAIWNTYARVNFAKFFLKIYKCLFITNCTRKIMRLRIGNIYLKYEIAYHIYAEAKRVHQVQK